MKKSALIIRAASAVALFLGAAVQYINADEFFCPPDDGACLIAAVNQSNSNGLENTIFLDTGTYPGGTQNPLIEITGPFPLTIMGQGAEQTAIVSAIFSIRDEAILTLNNLRITRAPVVAISNSGTLTIDGVIVDDTQTLDGAISNGGQASISNSTISGNAALDGSGGGISNFGFMEIKNSTISRNSAFDRGGGIANGGTLHIINTTIARNGAAAPRGNSPGGGIDNSGNLRIINSTISENGARRGAGIFNQGTVELQNTILARNTLGLSPSEGPDCVGVITSLGNNLIGDPTDCGISLQRSDEIGDPGLGEYAEDESVPGSGHFPLLPGSQAIDSGNRDVCPETDQLGQTRLGRCDIGAVEFKGENALLIVRRDAIGAGRSLVVRWRRIPEPQPTDWIGLYLPGSDNTAFIEWIYVSCSKTPGTPERRGSCDFPIPPSLAPGTYELRLLANDGFTLLATSDDFEVRQSRDAVATSQ